MGCMICTPCGTTTGCVSGKPGSWLLEGTLSSRGSLCGEICDPTAGSLRVQGVSPFPFHPFGYGRALVSPGRKAAGCARLR